MMAAGEDIECFLKELKNEFKITSKPAFSFSGIEIELIENGGIKISQKAYAKKFLEQFNFKDSKPVLTPLIKEPVPPSSSEESKKQAYTRTVLVFYREHLRHLQKNMLCT